MTPENQILPPKPPLNKKKNISYGRKVFLISLQACALMFGVLAIWLISYSREKTNEEVAETIIKQWGESVYIQGPTAKKNLDSINWLRPLSFNCNAEIITKSLHRGIYEAEVYTGNINISGKFEKDSLLKLGNSIVLQLGVITKQIINLGVLNFGNKEIPWHKSEYYLFALVELDDMPDSIEYSTSFEIKGSSGIFIKQIGEESDIIINGEAPNPSFTGYSLPINRSVSRGRFQAKWEDSIPVNTAYIDDFGFVGTNFLTGVDRYQLVERSLKYSFIIILLTFVSVLFVEIIRRDPIPLLNYFLIGAALIIYYSLLLSFVELTSFGVAYLIASVLTVVLISGYMWKMLNSRKLGISICIILSLTYLFIYIMLNISTYALLFGSLLLFLSLAAMMFASLKIKNPTN